MHLNLFTVYLFPEGKNRNKLSDPFNVSMSETDTRSEDDDSGIAVRIEVTASDDGDGSSQDLLAVDPEWIPSKRRIVRHSSERWISHKPIIPHA